MSDGLLEYLGVDCIDVTSGEDTRSRCPVSIVSSEISMVRPSSIDLTSLTEITLHTGGQCITVDRSYDLVREDWQAALEPELPKPKTRAVVAALDGVDWRLLYRQKLALLKLRQRQPEDSAEWDALSGVIHLLDALQDAESAG